ncbi:hypothetical protein [Methanoculleus receptaculi]|uniref:Uncharacterized protein n=1 Tax=Methanoculleus receptaculi TaxID=394967 RepID=A0AAX4FWV2_9EURY|nr:hypothetical protein [Methanoculleus receptaculi]WOX58387.1 hypothetical protein R6Y96_03885 [Methanoculleus receptaculi]
MNRNIGMRALSVLLAMLQVSVAMVPAVAAQSEKRFEEELLQNMGIKVNSIDTELCDYKTVGDTVFFNGNVKFDAESGVSGKFERIYADQQVSGYYSKNGSYHIESVGTNYRSAIDAQVISESSDAITLKIEQVVVKNGVVKVSSDIVTLPKTERPDINDFGGVSSIGLTSDKTKIDLPSMAPPGSTLVFNDVQYFYLVYGTAALAVVAAYFGVLPAVILGLAAVALEAAADYGDFDTEDCYLDVWLVPEPHPSAPILIEVDYIYLNTFFSLCDAYDS